MGNIISVSCGLDNVVAGCWDCAAGRASYTIDLRENLDTLKEELEELKELRNDNERQVKFAERQNMLPLDQVQGWLSMTETEIVEVEQMISDGSLEVDKLCLGVSCCKNPLSGDRFGKDVVKKIHRVRNLRIKGGFAVLANKGPSDVVEFKPSVPTQGLEETFASVMHSFKDTNVETIGIQGMGGIGKTTLLTLLNNNLLWVAHKYGIVIWVIVSRGSEVEMVQEEIAKRLDLYDERSLVYPSSAEDHLSNNLEVLSVSHCCKMEHIIAANKIELVFLFPHWQVLYLFHLVELKSIYERSLVYPSSAEVSIRGCPKLNISRSKS